MAPPVLGAILVLCLLLSACAQTGRQEAPPEEPAADIKEIQAGVMSFSDTWASSIRQVTALMLEGIEDPKLRLDLQRNWYYSTLSMYDIAAGPYPGISLLDTMVVASLTRRIWERHGLKKYGDSGRAMLKVLTGLEENIWTFSASYLDESQRQDLLALVKEWLARHPGARSASFIRFSDFGELGRKPTLEQAVKKGGFLSPIRDAAESAEEIKELAERALFLSIRMQELMIGRAQILARDLLDSGEIRQLLEDVHGFRGTAQRYAEIAETIPAELEALVAFTLDEVSAEREAALQQVLEGVAVERTAAIEQMLVAVSTERGQALAQTLEGLRVERLGLLKASAHVLYWIELQLRASIVRLFIVVACLIVLWFGLRLIYRYWVDRVADSFTKVLGVAVLFLVLIAPTLFLSNYLVGLIRPDFAEQKEFGARIDEVLKVFHSVVAEQPDREED